MRTTEVNHFEKKNENGTEYWYWEDKKGSYSGRDRKWKYKVKVGDTFVEKGSCPQGYKYYQIKYSGQPEQL